MGARGTCIALATGALALANAAAVVDYQCPAESDDAGSFHKGGSMVTAGSNSSLPRVSYHLDVHIIGEGGRECCRGSSGWGERIAGRAGG